MKQRKLLSARSSLALLAGISFNHKAGTVTPGQLQRELEAQVQRVEKLLEKGRAFEIDKNANEAVRVYQEILSIAVDVAEAEKGLKRCPPEPAENVRAQVYDGKIVVEWRESQAVGNLEYLLVRGEDRAPVSPSDGTLVARVSNNSFCDEAVRPGSFVLYSVFTERGGIHSRAAVSGGVLASRVEISRSVGDARCAGVGILRPAGRSRPVRE